MTAVLEERPVALTENAQPSEWRRVSRLTLAALPSAVGCSRLLARHTLIDSPLDEHSATEVERAVSELVSHAVATTGITDALPTYSSVFDNLTLITVRLSIGAWRALVEVWDCGTAPPQPQLGQSDAIAKSREWGYDIPSPGRRVVWCVLPLSAETDQAETTVLPQALPRRVARLIPGGPVRTMRDPEILRRVLDGLRNLDDAGNEAGEGSAQ